MEKEEKICGVFTDNKFYTVYEPLTPDELDGALHLQALDLSGDQIKALSRTVAERVEESLNNMLKDGPPSWGHILIDVKKSIRMSTAYEDGGKDFTLYDVTYVVRNIKRMDKKTHKITD